MPPNNNLNSLVADPDFQKLAPADQRRAMSGVTGDNTFGQLNDDQTRQYVSSHQAALQPPTQSGSTYGQPYTGKIPSSTEALAQSTQDEANANEQIGRTYFNKGPAEIGGGVKDIAQGNVGHGIHRIISGAGVSTLPVTAPALPFLAMSAPVAMAVGAGGSYAGGKAFRYGAQQAGLSDDWQNVAGDVGNIAGGLGGAKLGGAVSDAVSKLASNINYEPAQSVKLPWWLGGGKLKRGTPDVNLGNGAVLPADEAATYLKQGYKPVPDESMPSGKLPWQSSNFRLVLTPEEVADQEAQGRLAGVVKEQLRPEAEVGGMYSAARGKVSKIPDYQGRIAKRLYK